jgi:hypothetical protein
MDAKAQELSLIAALALFCAGFAWVEDHAVLDSVFFALGVVAMGGADTGPDMARLILKRASIGSSQEGYVMPHFARIFLITLHQLQQVVRVSASKRQRLRARRWVGN